MPLKRGKGEPEIENLVGVNFSMNDSGDGRHVVVCKVRYVALRDRGAADNPKLDWFDAWTKHRSDIEALASSNYDNGKPLDDDGRVIVDTGELTPLPDTPTRWAP